MSHLTIPEGYTPVLNLYDTQKAIGLTKRLFEDMLCGALNLRRVSAPLFLEASTGLNDDLNGVERPVSFTIRDTGTEAQVVHSLAKWKRQALHDYGFEPGSGLYTDMNAIRPVGLGKGHHQRRTYTGVSLPDSAQHRTRDLCDPEDAVGDLPPAEHTCSA